MKSVYLHVSNGGIEFEITDEIGPTVKISMSLFGMPSSIKFHTSKQGLKDIGRLFMACAEDDVEYSSVFCHSAEYHDYGKPEHGNGIMTDDMEMVMEGMAEDEDEDMEMGEEPMEVHDEDMN